MTEIPPVNVDWQTNGGQAWFIVSNPSQAEANVTLCAPTCAGSVPHVSLPGQITLQNAADTSGLPVLSLALKAGESKPFKLVVRDYRRPGESIGTVSLNGAPHDFRVRLFQVPFKVGLQSATADMPQVSFSRGAQGLLVLTNDDPVGYPVRWCLYLPNNSNVVGGQANLPANGAVPIAVMPPASWFRSPFQGLFKDEQQSGHLSLRMDPAEQASGSGSEQVQCEPGTPHPRISVSEQSLPSKTLPVAMSLAYWQNGKYFGYLIMILVLALGAALSVVLNGWIPNYLSRATLIRRLDVLVGSIRAISSQTDSRLRVLLGVERIRLQDQLAALKAPNLDTADQIKQLGVDVDTLSRRVDLVARLDAIGTQCRMTSMTNADIPATVLDKMSANLARATEALSSSSLQVSGYQLASATMDAALSSLQVMGVEDPALAQDLARRVVELDTQYLATGEIGQTTTCKTVRNMTAPALFSFLENPDYKDPTKIQTSEYRFLDISATRLIILRDYIRIAEIIAQDPNDAKGRRMLGPCTDQLFEQLRRTELDALARARCLVKQLDERVIADDIEAGLQKGLGTLAWSPTPVFPNQPLRLSVQLTSLELADRTAQEDFTCEWSFPYPVGAETGWEITHYFRKQAEATFTVRFRKRNGDLVRSANGGEPLTLESRQQHFLLDKPDESKLSDTAKAESLRLVLALGLAIMGLVAGAQEQFLKLDIVFGLLSVLMLGFSADTIKNLFAKRS